ncbi:MAG: hypothetical protein IJ483_03790 [Flavobacteriales bacterium]|nr:hypothetical protein [Flavobacteriales bacterium]
MKNKFIFTATAAVLLCLGVLLYATTNKSTTLTTFSTEEVADNTETVSSPPEVSCTAYYIRRYDYISLSYVYNVVTTLPNDNYDWEIIDSREGTVFECPTCPSTCSAYYELCDEYKVEYEY